MAGPWTKRQPVLSSPTWAYQPSISEPFGSERIGNPKQLSFPFMPQSYSKAKQLSFPFISTISETEQFKTAAAYGDQAWADFIAPPIRKVSTPLSSLPGPSFLSRHLGKSLIIGSIASLWLYNRIASRDDYYNTIEGMPEQGMASIQRKLLTDFGSGYKGEKEPQVPGHVKYFTAALPFIAGGYYRNDIKALLTGRRTLYHGTTEEAAQSILRTGLQRSYSAKSGGIIDQILLQSGKFKKDEIADFVYLTSKRLEGQGYAFQATSLAQGMPPEEIQKLRYLPAAMLGRKGKTLTFSIPTWQEEFLSVKKVNPEIAKYAGWKEFRNKVFSSLRDLGNPAMQRNMEAYSAYKTLNKAFVYDKDIGTEFLVSSTTFKKLSLPEWTQYLKKHPGRFAGGLAAIAGLGFIAKNAINLFSGKDDAYNTIPGMQHKGIAGRSRPNNTDFGSGYEGQEESIDISTILKGINYGFFIVGAGITGYDRFGVKGAIGGAIFGAGLNYLGEEISPKKTDTIPKIIAAGAIQGIIMSSSMSLIASSMMKGASLSGLSKKLISHMGRAEAIARSLKINVNEIEEMGFYGLQGRYVRNRIEKLIPGKYGKAIGIGIESQVSAPTMLDLVMKYGSIRNIPAKEYIFANLKDVGLGAFSGSLVSIPMSLIMHMFSGKDDAYNTIEGMRHEGMAGASRSQNTDFGSGFLPKQLRTFKDKLFATLRNKLFVLSSAKDVYRIAKHLPVIPFMKQGQIINPAKAARMAQRTSSVQQFAQKLGLNEQSFIFSKTQAGMKQKIGELDLSQFHPSLKQGLQERLPGMGAAYHADIDKIFFTQSRVKQFQSVLQGKAKNQQLTKAILQQSQGVTGFSNLDFENAILYHEYVERGIWKSIETNRFAMASHFSAHPIIGESAFIKTHKNPEVQNLLRIMRSNDPQEKSAFAIGEDLSLFRKENRPVIQIEGMQHGGLAQLMRNILTPFSSKYNRLKAIFGTLLNTSKTLLQTKKPLLNSLSNQLNILEPYLSFTPMVNRGLIINPAKAARMASRTSSVQQFAHKLGLTSEDVIFTQNKAQLSGILKTLLPSKQYASVPQALAAHHETLLGAGASYFHGYEKIFLNIERSNTWMARAQAFAQSKKLQASFLQKNLRKVHKIEATVGLDEQSIQKKISTLIPKEIKYKAQLKKARTQMSSLNQLDLANATLYHEYVERGMARIINTSNAHVLSGHLTAHPVIAEAAFLKASKNKPLLEFYKSIRQVSEGEKTAFNIGENLQLFRKENRPIIQIEGMTHGGEAEKMRKILTPFSSKYNRLKAIAKILTIPYEKMLKSKGFKQALVSAKYTGIAGEGVYSKVRSFIGTYRGHEFTFIKKSIKPGAAELITRSTNPQYFSRGLDLKREMKFYKALEHTPAVPSPYGMIDESLYMEHMPGTTLKKFITENPSKVIADKARQELNETIIGMHEKRIYNKDIHLGNVMYDTSSGRISMIDLGLASHVQVNHDMFAYTTKMQSKYASMPGVFRPDIPAPGVNTPLTADLGIKRSIKNDTAHASTALAKDLGHSDIGQQLTILAEELKIVQKNLWSAANNGGKRHRLYSGRKSVRVQHRKI